MESKAIALAGELLELPDAERAARLEEVSRRDPLLAARTRVLLAEAPGLETFLAEPPFVLSAETVEHALPPGAWIGPYQVLGPLGSGASADVYEVQSRDGGPSRALKLMRVGPGTAPPDPAALAEVRALRRLEHPGIARLVDSGMAEVEGRPRAFLVTECVRGLPITLAAAERGLDTVARLELMARVCDAVEHAHGRLVLHRDLKPANVLVPMPVGDEGPQAVVLDFGLAAGLAADSRLAMAVSTRGSILGRHLPAGSLAYMSPEQLDVLDGGDAGRIGPPTDVYALGVMLFELLAGTLPHGRAGQPVLAMIREVRERPAPRVASLVPELRGDVDQVVAAALAKDPEQRYRSAGALADDLRRVLKGEPIAMRPPGSGYFLRLVLRRYRRVLLLAGALMLVMAALAVTASIQWSRAVRAERLANEQADQVLAAGTAIVDRIVPELLAIGGSSAATGGMLAELEETLRRAVALRPDDARLIDVLALVLLQRSFLGGAIAFDERVALARESLALREGLASRFPGDSARRMGLELSRLQVASLLRDESAAEAFRRDIANCEAALAGELEPGRRDAVQVILVHRLRTLGELTGDAALATRAVATARELVARSPHDLDAASELGCALADLARLTGPVDRGRAIELADEARGVLLRASDDGLGSHPSILRNLGRLEIDTALLNAGRLPGVALLELAGSGLARLEMSARLNSGMPLPRRDLRRGLVRYGEAALAVADAAPASDRGELRRLAAARLAASIAEHDALPPIDTGMDPVEQEVAKAREILERLRERAGLAPIGDALRERAPFRTEVSQRALVVGAVLRHPSRDSSERGVHRIGVLPRIATLPRCPPSSPTSKPPSTEPGSRRARSRPCTRGARSGCATTFGRWASRCGARRCGIGRRTSGGTASCCRTRTTPAA